MAEHDPSYKHRPLHGRAAADLYIGLLYQDLAAAGEIPTGGGLPPVLPIVLYNGERTWWVKTSLDELIELEGLTSPRCSGSPPRRLAG